MPQQLRFAVMLRDGSLRNWHAKCIQALLDIEGVELALVINEPRGESQRKSLAALFRLYSRLFLRAKALAHADSTSLFGKLPAVVCAPSSTGKVAASGRSEYLERIQGYSLDFILRFEPGKFEGKEMLGVARYGVWSFQYGNLNGDAGEPAGFWEIYRGETVTSAELVRSMEKPGSDVVLRKGFFRTQFSSYSRNIQQLCIECARWPSQACRDILANNTDHGSSVSNIIPAVCGPPNNRQTFRFMLRIISNRLRAFYRALFRYSFWNIGVVEAPIEKFLDRGFKPRIAWLPRPPKGEFRADPFGMLQPPSIHVFYENLDYHAPKGIIYTTEVLKGQFVGPQKKMIELPVHMSYPYLVEHDGSLYCVPETNRAREVSVYKSTRFPDEWRKVGTLLKDVMAIDTTIFQHEGMWWMMFTDREKGGDANLFVWYSTDFWGPWKPHTNNPVKSDVRSARPGGTPFYYEGQLYRPAQDCSTTGGGRTVINRVKQLSPTMFDEESVAVIEPDRSGPYPEGLHTLSKVGEFTLVDGKRFEFSMSGLMNNISKGIRRTFDRE